METKHQLAEEYAPKDRATIYSQLICDRERAAFIAGYEAAQRWIPVEEELPDESQFVFVLSDVGDAYVTYYLGGVFTPVHPIRFKITHWLPIPKLQTK